MLLHIYYQDSGQDIFILLITFFCVDVYQFQTDKKKLLSLSISLKHIAVSIYTSLVLYLKREKSWNTLLEL